MVNPAELNPDASTDWHACLRRDIAAHRIASMAAEELVRCEGAPTNAPDEFALAPCQIDEHMRECIEHLIYSGLAITFEREDGTLIVQLGDFTLEGLA